MKSRRFLLTLLVAGTSLAGSLHAIAAPASASAASFDTAFEKGRKGDPPRPVPTPGPRDGGDD